MLIEQELIWALSTITMDNHPHIYKSGSDNIESVSFNLWQLEGFIVSLIVEKTGSGKLALSLKSLSRLFSPQGITLKSKLVPSMDKMDEGLIELFDFLETILPYKLYSDFKAGRFLVRCGLKQALILRTLSKALSHLGYDSYTEEKGVIILGVCLPYTMQGLYPDIILKEGDENIVVTIYHPHLSASYLNDASIVDRLDRQVKEEAEILTVNKRFSDAKNPLDVTDLCQKVVSMVNCLSEESKVYFRQLISDFEELK